MEIYSYDGLKELIRQTPDINFVAFVKTPWQLHGVNAFLYSLISDHITPKGIVCMEKNAQYGFVINEAQCRLVADGVQCVRYDYFAGRKGAYAKVKNALSTWKACVWERRERGGEPVYLLQCLEPNYHLFAFVTGALQRKAVSVILDEGLGVYIRSKREMVREALSYHHSLLKKVKICYNHYIKRPVLSAAMKRHGRVIDFQLFERTGNDLVRRDSVVACYSKIWKLTAMPVPREEAALYQGAVVINTQPFFEMGQIKNDEDLRIIEGIAKACLELRCKCVIKPHPRENHLERYEKIQGLTVDANQSISQEALLAALPALPLLIVGFSSTTLVTTRLFFGVRTMSLARIRLEHVGERMRNDCRDFCATFGSVVECPVDMPGVTNSIVSMIESVKVNGVD